MCIFIMVSKLGSNLFVFFFNDKKNSAFKLSNTNILNNAQWDFKRFTMLHNGRIWNQTYIQWIIFKRFFILGIFQNLMRHIFGYGNINQHCCLKMKRFGLLSKVYKLNLFPQQQSK